MVAIFLATMFRNTKEEEKVDEVADDESVAGILICRCLVGSRIFFFLIWNQGFKKNSFKCLTLQVVRDAGENKHVG